MRFPALALLLVSMMVSAPVMAQTVSVDIEIAPAERLLAIACSGEEIDESEFSQSRLLLSQIAHHREFAERFSLENYLIGVRAIARCEVPDPDPFRFSALVERREEMEGAITYLVQRRAEIGDSAAQLLTPYVPEGFDFEGNAVLAAASFSCGGFARDGAFFVDIPCLAADMPGNYEALVRLITHETYHAIQEQFAAQPIAEFEAVCSLEEALDHMFANLMLEGSASHVAAMQDIEGEGRYASFSRSLARRNFRHLAYNFQLFDYMIEALVRDPEHVAARFPEIYGLAFDGAFGELGYYTGQQMTAEIEHSFGAVAIPCLLALPGENYVLGYAQALADNDNLASSAPFDASTLDAALWLSQRRSEPANFETCLSRS
jgi:putative zinc-dependent peptidase DUF5700